MAVLVPNERLKQAQEEAKKGIRRRATLLVPQNVEEIWRHKCATMEKSLFASLEAHAEDVRMVLRTAGVKFKKNSKLDELRAKLGEWLAEEEAKRQAEAEGAAPENSEEGA